MNKKGFTLMEMLVVVAIVGILTTTLVALVVDKQGDAQDAAGVSAVTATGLAFRVEQFENGDYPAFNMLRTVATSSIINMPGITISDPTLTNKVFCVSYALQKPEETRAFFVSSQTGTEYRTATQGGC